MKDYFLSKLSIINYRISIHEGDANRRLTSQAVEIYHKLFLSEVPDEYKRDFDKLLKLIKKTLNDSGDQCLHPVRLNGIRSSTAAKYIKLLIDIEYKMRENEEDL